jgi:hypothetical protein
LATIVWKYVEAFAGMLDRITPGRFLEWSLEAIFEPEVLFDLEAILFVIVLWLDPGPHRFCAGDGYPSWDNGRFSGRHVFG